MHYGHDIRLEISEAFTLVVILCRIWGVRDSDFDNPGFYNQNQTADVSAQHSIYNLSHEIHMNSVTGSKLSALCSVPCALCTVLYVQKSCWYLEVG